MVSELASAIHKKKRCSKCKRDLLLGCFKTVVRKGEKKLTTTCIKCLDKVSDYYKTPEGKASQKLANQTYNKTDKGKAAKKAGRKAAVEVIKKRRAADPAYALRLNLAVLANGLVSGKNATSPTFLQHTAFVSEAQFIAHLRKKVKAAGFEWDDHGITWVIEHIIPIEAYDFANPEDVRRCWSPENVRALAPEANNKKGYKLINKLCRKVGPARFPLSWKGVLLTREQKEAFYAKCNPKSWVPVESEE